MTDVDGTLTDAARRLDPRAMAALRRAESTGIPVVLATGNVLPVALALHRFLGLSGPIVAENGGLIYRRGAGVETVTRLAHRAVALRAFHRLKRAGLPVRALFTDRWRITEVALEPDVPLRAIRRVLREDPVTVESTGYATHLMERGMGKLPAVERALRPLDLTPEDCLVAGDGDNDVPMLRAAGLSVSFPTGSPAARRAADWVTRAGRSRGFVEALKRAGVVPPTSGG